MPPRPHVRFSLGAALWFAAMAAALLTSEASLAEECSLTAPLVVKDLQGGVVGQTGTVWTIAPDCSFTVARQTGTHVSAPHRQGRLSPTQRQQLASAVERTAIAELPARLGPPPRPNGRQITVSYGHSAATLTLPPRDNAAATTDPVGGGAGAHVLALANTVKDMIGR